MAIMLEPLDQARYHSTELVLSDGGHSVKRSPQTVRGGVALKWGPGDIPLRGKGGVPWVQIMENEFEYLADRGGHGGHLGLKFVKKYCS